MSDSDDRLGRRRVVEGCGAAAVGLLAGCIGGGGGGGGGGDGGSGGDDDGGSFEPPEAAETYLGNVGNYDGFVDHTGESEVTVEVGVDANGGAFGFGPAAIRVDAGTTVVWEWTGRGAQHNVVEEDGGYESELVTEGGHTFSRAFEETGVSRYFCQPHKTMGMKGVVVVE